MMNITNSDASVIYPTVDLFLYELMQGLGDAGLLVERRKQFYRKIYGDREDRYSPLQQRECDSALFCELHPHQIEPFADPSDGYYYPVQLVDTYALRVNCAGKLQADGQDNLEPQALATKAISRKVFTQQEAESKCPTWEVLGCVAASFQLFS